MLRYSNGVATQEIDLDALHTALDTERATQGIRWRDVATITGISASTFSRLGDGKGIDLNAYAACCHWLGVSLDVFTTQTTTSTSSLATELMILMRRYDVPRVLWQPLVELITQLHRMTPDTVVAPTRAELGPPPA